MKVAYEVSICSLELINEEGTEKKEETTTTKELKYKYEQIVTIDASVKEIQGYNVTWTKWNSSNKELQSDLSEKNAEIKIPAGDIELTATAEKNAKIYNITYELEGGTLPQGVENPATYTIESQNLEINNLKDGTKLGYNFAGWTGGVVNESGVIDNSQETGTTGNISTPTKQLIIKPGSIGNRKYTANWEKAEFQYKIEYYYENVLDEEKTELIEIVNFLKEVLTNPINCCKIT